MCMFNSKLTYACAVFLLIYWSIFQVNLVIMTPGQCMKHMCLNSVLYPTRSVKCSPFLMLYWLCNQAFLVVNIGTCDVVLFSCLTAVITWILVFVICWWHVWKKKNKKKKTQHVCLQLCMGMKVYSVTLRHTVYSYTEYCKFKIW